MATPISYLPEGSIPSIRVGNEVQFTKYSNETERKQAAEPWIKRINKIARREDEYIAEAAIAQRVYDEDMYTDRFYFDRPVVMNMFKKIVAFYMSALYPSFAKPVINTRPTFNEKLNKIFAEVADIKQIALEVFMDNGAFDTVAMEALKEALVTGRGIIRCYLTVDPRTQEQIVTWKSIPHNRIYIPEADDHDSIEYIAQRHVIPKDDASLYMDPDMQKQYADGLPMSMPWTDSYFHTERDQNDIYDAYEVYEIWERPKINKGQPQPGMHYFIRGNDNMMLSARQDPYNLPGFFPFTQPLIPHRMKGGTPKPLFESFRHLHEALQMSFWKDIDTLDRTTIKGYTMHKSEAWQQFVEAREPVVVQDFDSKQPEQSGLSQMAMAGIDDVNKSIYWWPIEQEVGFMGALTETQQKFIDKIYEVSGVSDIQQGMTQLGETATAQRIKQFNNNLRIRSLWNNTRFMIQDAFQISADLIHRHIGQDPQSLQRLTGRLDPNDQSTPQVVYAFQNPDFVAHKIDVTSESLEITDSELQQQRTINSLALLKQFRETMPLGNDPQDLKDHWELYLRLLEAIGNTPNIERPMRDTFERQIDKYGELAEVEQQNPQLKQIREEKAKKDAIQMDPKHQEVIKDKELAQLDLFKATLNNRIEQQKDQTENRKITNDWMLGQGQLRNEQAKTNIDRLFKQGSLKIDTFDKITRRREQTVEAWLAKKNYYLEKQKIAKGISSSGAKYEEISSN